MTEHALPHGATPEDWAHFSLILGLQADLLPVVSNQAATISPESNMQDLGKTPSIYNRRRQVAGVAKWPTHVTSSEEIARWSEEPDYGICIQARTVRAIDIDVPDRAAAARILEVVRETIGELPMRHRTNSGKCLLAFGLPGDYSKRAFKTEGGIVEFLATGQQFIACGTHPSGFRYEWAGGLPDEIPELSPEQFDVVWAALVAEFATETSSTVKGKDRKNVLQETLSLDPVVAALYAAGSVQATEQDGRLHIVCPFAEDHTDGVSVGSSTTYFPAHTGGYERGHFSCLHASCSGFSDADFLEKLGLGENPADDFEVLAEVASLTPTSKGFVFTQASAFASGPPPKWLIKGLLPEAELVVIYGAPASGKSFFVLDAGLCVALGRPWRDTTPVAKGVVAYVCAEGAHGFRNRLNAYAIKRSIDLSTAELYVLGAGPNFTKTAEVSKLIGALAAIAAPVKLVVVDTLSRVMVGADENSAQDMGAAIAACKALHTATGATVVLIHHSGKDPGKGSRGHSSLLGAADAEIEIIRLDQHRAATLTKVKDGDGEGQEYGFELESVVLGVDEDMEDITSCVVEHKAEAVAKTERRGHSVTNTGSYEQLVLRKLAELEDSRLDNTPAPYADLHAVCVDSLPLEPGKTDRRGEHVTNAVRRLTSRNRVSIKDGAISIIGSAS